MTDILLIQPPIRDFYLTVKRTLPYGLASIAASLEKDGFSVEILDALAVNRTRDLSIPPEMAYLESYYGRPDRSPFALFHRFRHFGMGFEAIGERARRSGAWLVGISSLFTPYAREALDTAAAVRRHHPEARIVLGGHHPTAFPEKVLQHQAVDFVLRGDGEPSLPALARALKCGTPLQDVPGIAFQKTGAGVHVGAPAVVPDLNALPLPAIDQLHRTYYRRDGKTAAVVTASRGCPLSCSYCSIGGSDWLSYRRKSVSRVMEEIEAAVGGDGAGFIDFEDENLSMDREWFRDLLSRILSRFGPRTLELRAMNGLFPPSLSRPIVKLMHTAGFQILNLSLGSFSRVQQDRFRRPDVGRAFIDALAWAQETGLQAVGYIVVGAPHQDPNESLSDLLLLARCRVLAGVSVFYPAPGSMDYDRCRKLSLLPDSFSLMRSSALPVDHLTDRLQAVTLLRLGRILNFAKSLVDAGIPLPQPAEPPGQIKPSEDRIAIGRLLLAGFLADGGIRGVTPGGEVYLHTTDSTLSETFRRGIRDITIEGVKR